MVITGEINKGYNSQLKELISSKEKRSLNKSTLSNDVNLIKNFYSSLGFNFAKVNTKLKKIDEDNFDVLIEIDRGEKTKISSIKFVGNNSIRGNRLKDIIASEESKFWKVISRNTVLSENLINLDIRLLRNYYRSIGFYDVKISSNFAEVINEKEAKLIYSIDEGNRYVLGKISTNLDSVFDKKLFLPLNKTYKKYIGQYYSPFKIQKILVEIDELIAANSLQFVEHNVEEQINDNSIDIIFNIFEGQKELVERINIKGNSITNEDVIRGELLLDEEIRLQKLI